MTEPGNRSTTLSELAKLVDGTLVGNGDIRITRVARVHEAQAGDIVFVASARYLEALAGSAASAVIVHPGFGYTGAIPRIETTNPYLAFAKVQTLLAVSKPECRGVSADAHISASAVIEDGVTVSPGCFVGNNVRIGAGTCLDPGVVLYDDVTVGRDCRFYAGVVVRERCRVGDRVILHANCTIGSDGFGFAPDGERYYKIPQIGSVVIEDDVEIGSCSCVDRAAMGETVIGSGCKIDNLVQVAHNVIVGENTIMVAQTGIAGSAVIGRHCTFGGQSASVGHIKVGDNVTVVARGAVSGNVGPNEFVAGFPMMPHKDWLKSKAGFSKLPDMRRELQQLKRKLDELEDRLKEK